MPRATALHDAMGFGSYDRRNATSGTQPGGGAAEQTEGAGGGEEVGGGGVSQLEALLSQQKDLSAAMLRNGTPPTPPTPLP